MVKRKFRNIAIALTTLSVGLITGPSFAVVQTKSASQKQIAAMAHDLKGFITILNKAVIGNNARAKAGLIQVRKHLPTINTKIYTLIKCFRMDPKGLGEINKIGMTTKPLSCQSIYKPHAYKLIHYVPYISKIIKHYIDSKQSMEAYEKKLAAAGKILEAQGLTNADRRTLFFSLNLNPNFASQIDLNIAISRINNDVNYKTYLSKLLPGVLPKLKSDNPQLTLREKIFILDHTILRMMTPKTANAIVNNIIGLYRKIDNTRIKNKEKRILKNALLSNRISTLYLQTSLNAVYDILKSSKIKKRKLAARLIDPLLKKIIRDIRNNDFLNSLQINPFEFNIENYARGLLKSSQNISQSYKFINRYAPAKTNKNKIITALLTSYPDNIALAKSIYIISSEIFTNKLYSKNLNSYIQKEFFKYISKNISYGSIKNPNSIISQTAGLMLFTKTSQSAINILSLNSRNVVGIKTLTSALESHYPRNLVLANSIIYFNENVIENPQVPQLLIPDLTKLFTQNINSSLSKKGLASKPEIDKILTSTVSKVNNITIMLSSMSPLTSSYVTNNLIDTFRLINTSKLSAKNKLKLKEALLTDRPNNLLLLTSLNSIFLNNTLKKINRADLLKLVLGQIKNGSFTNDVELNPNKFNYNSYAQNMWLATLTISSATTYLYQNTSKLKNYKSFIKILYSDYPDNITLATAISNLSGALTSKYLSPSFITMMQTNFNTDLMKSIKNGQISSVAGIQATSNKFLTYIAYTTQATKFLDTNSENVSSIAKFRKALMTNFPKNLPLAQMLFFYKINIFDNKKIPTKLKQLALKSFTGHLVNDIKPNHDIKSAKKVQSTTLQSINDVLLVNSAITLLNQLKSKYPESSTKLSNYLTNNYPAGLKLANAIEYYNLKIVTNKNLSAAIKPIIFKNYLKSLAAIIPGKSLKKQNKAILSATGKFQLDAILLSGAYKFIHTDSNIVKPPASLATLLTEQYPENVALAQIITYFYSNIMKKNNASATVKKYGLNRLYYALNLAIANNKTDTEKTYTKKVLDAGLLAVQQTQITINALNDLNKYSDATKANTLFDSQMINTLSSPTSTNFILAKSIDLTRIELFKTFKLTNNLSASMFHKFISELYSDKTISDLNSKDYSSNIKSIVNKALGVGYVYSTALSFTRKYASGSTNLITAIVNGYGKKTNIANAIMSLHLTLKNSKLNKTTKDSIMRGLITNLHTATLHSSTISDTKILNLYSKSMIAEKNIASALGILKSSNNAIWLSYTAKTKLISALESGDYPTTSYLAMAIVTADKAPVIHPTSALGSTVVKNPWGTNSAQFMFYRGHRLGGMISTLATFISQSNGSTSIQYNSAKPGTGLGAYIEAMNFMQLADTNPKSAVLYAAANQKLMPGIISTLNQQGYLGSTNLWTLMHSTNSKYSLTVGKNTYTASKIFAYPLYKVFPPPKPHLTWQQKAADFFKGIGEAIIAPFKAHDGSILHRIEGLVEDIGLVAGPFMEPVEAAEIADMAAEAGVEVGDATAEGVAEISNIARIARIAGIAVDDGMKGIGDIAEHIPKEGDLLKTGDLAHLTDLSNLDDADDLTELDHLLKDGDLPKLDIDGEDINLSDIDDDINSKELVDELLRAEKNPLLNSSSRIIRGIGSAYDTIGRGLARTMDAADELSANISSYLSRGSEALSKGARSRLASLARYFSDSSDVDGVTDSDDGDTSTDGEITSILKSGQGDSPIKTSPFDGPDESIKTSTLDNIKTSISRMFKKIFGKAGKSVTWDEDTLETVYTIEDDSREITKYDTDYARFAREYLRDTDLDKADPEEVTTYVSYAKYYTKYLKSLSQYGTDFDDGSFDLAKEFDKDYNDKLITKLKQLETILNEQTTTASDSSKEVESAMQKQVEDNLDKLDRKELSRIYKKLLGETPEKGLSDEEIKSKIIQEFKDSTKKYNSLMKGSLDLRPGGAELDDVNNPLSRYKELKLIDKESLDELNELKSRFHESDTAKFDINDQIRSLKQINSNMEADELIENHGFKNFTKQLQSIDNYTQKLKKGSQSIESQYRFVQSLYDTTPDVEAALKSLKDERASLEDQIRTLQEADQAKNEDEINKLETKLNNEIKPAINQLESFKESIYKSIAESYKSIAKDIESGTRFNPNGFSDLRSLNQSIEDDMSRKLDSLQASNTELSALIKDSDNADKFDALSRQLKDQTQQLEAYKEMLSKYDISADEKAMGEFKAKFYHLSATDPNSPKIKFYQDEYNKYELNIKKIKASEDYKSLYQKIKDAQASERKLQQELSKLTFSDGDKEISGLEIHDNIRSNLAKIDTLESQLSTIKSLPKIVDFDDENLSQFISDTEDWKPMSKYDNDMAAKLRLELNDVNPDELDNEDLQTYASKLKYYTNYIYNLLEYGTTEEGLGVDFTAHLYEDFTDEIFPHTHALVSELDERWSKAISEFKDRIKVILDNMKQSIAKSDKESLSRIYKKLTDVDPNSDWDEAELRSKLDAKLDEAFKKYSTKILKKKGADILDSESPLKPLLELGLVDKTSLDELNRAGSHYQDLAESSKQLNKLIKKQEILEVDISISRAGFSNYTSRFNKMNSDLKAFSKRMIEIRTGEKVATDSSLKKSFKLLQELDDTQADLAKAIDKIKSQQSQIESEIAALKSQLDDASDTVATELNSDISALEDTLEYTVTNPLDSLTQFDNLIRDEPPKAYASIISDLKSGLKLNPEDMRELDTFSDRMKTYYSDQIKTLSTENSDLMKTLKKSESQYEEYQKYARQLDQLKASPEADQDEIDDLEYELVKLKFPDSKDDTISGKYIYGTMSRNTAKIDEFKRSLDDINSMDKLSGVLDASPSVSPTEVHSDNDTQPNQTHLTGKTGIATISYGHNLLPNATSLHQTQTQVSTAYAAYQSISEALTKNKQEFAKASTADKSKLYQASIRLETKKQRINSKLTQLYRTLKNQIKGSLHKIQTHYQYNLSKVSTTAFLNMLKNNKTIDLKRLESNLYQLTTSKSMSQSHVASIQSDISKIILAATALKAEQLNTVKLIDTATAKLFSTNKQASSMANARKLVKGITNSLNTKLENPLSLSFDKQYNQFKQLIRSSKTLSNLYLLHEYIHEHNKYDILKNSINEFKSLSTKLQSRTLSPQLLQTIKSFHDKLTSPDKSIPKQKMDSLFSAPSVQNESRAIQGVNQE